MKAECFSKLDRNAEAITWYDKAIEVDDENAMIWNGKGNAYFNLETMRKPASASNAPSTSTQRPSIIISALSKLLLSMATSTMQSVWQEKRCE